MAAVLLVAAVLAIRAEVVAPTRVAGDSMRPSLARGDIAIVQKLGVSPQRGDVVVFTSPEDGRETVKRVIGMPGDVVAIRDAVLYVNDERIDEPFVDYAAIDGLLYGPVTVPAGRVIVLGDNRAQSVDSRTYGPLDLAAITGEIHYTIWPVGHLS